MKNLHIKKTTMLGVFASSLLVAASAVYIYSPTFGSHAAESKEAEINLTVASALGIRTSADNLNLEANIGDFTHGSIDVDVTTNSQYGYTLTLEDSDNESSLVHTNSSISDKLTSAFAGAKTELTKVTPSPSARVIVGANPIEAKKPFTAPVRSTKQE